MDCTRLNAALIFLQDGFTPIMIAAKVGHKEVVELFKMKCNQEEPSEEVLVSEFGGYCVLLNVYFVGCHGSGFKGLIMKNNCRHIIKESCCLIHDCTFGDHYRDVCACAFYSRHGRGWGQGGFRATATSLLGLYEGVVCYRSSSPL